jgi:hypothetical protein
LEPTGGHRHRRLRGLLWNSFERSKYFTYLLSLRDLSEQTGFLPSIPVLAATNVQSGEVGKLALVGGRLVFLTDAGIRFGVKLNNVVNFEIRDDIVELDARLSGVTIRALRYQVPKEDVPRWFRAIFFAWVISKRRESKLALDWEPASYLTKGRPDLARDKALIGHDYLISRLVGNKADRAEFEKLLGAPDLAKLGVETAGFEKRAMVERVATIEFEKMASRVYKSGWRESYGTFDQGSPIVFLSAIPSINQRGMREEFWGWYDVNEMLFERFREAHRLGDRVTGLIVKRVAEMTKERIGEYAGLADEALRSKPKLR